MGSVSTFLSAAAVLSALGLLTVCLQQTGTFDRRLFRPLVMTMLSFNGIGVTLLLGSLTGGIQSAGLGSMVMDTIILLLQLGCLGGLLLFFVRLLRPDALRAARFVVLGAASLIALAGLGGWIDFMLSKRITSLASLVAFVDHGVYLGVMGMALWALLARTDRSGRGSTPAIRSLSLGLLAFHGILLAWGLMAGQVRARHPGVRDAFNATAFLVFNTLGSIWLAKHGGQLNLGRPRGDSHPSIPDRWAARHGISRRESEIITWVISGKSNRDIAEALNISIHTAKEHVSNILRKTGAKNRVQLARMLFDASRDPQAGTMAPG